MKTRVFRTLALGVVVIGFLSAAAQGANGVDVWQIGKSDGGLTIDPIDAAMEYPANRHWTATYDYYVGTDEDPINSPSMPGVIGPKNVCDFTGNGRPCTDTTAQLNIHFSLGCKYEAGELTLIYDRYGSEANYLHLDGEEFAFIPPTPYEGKPSFLHYSFDDLAPQPGDHTITIVYAGGGSDNGHYIDYLKLVSIFRCVSIDIKPGSDPNCFNNDGHGVIPVAILGTETFDVTSIDPETVALEGLEVKAVGKSNKLLAHIEDVNGDGFDDLVVKIEDTDGAFEPGDTEATLTGNLYDGTPIEGTDSICIRPPE